MHRVFFLQEGSDLSRFVALEQGAVRYPPYQVHQFVGGFDAACTEDLEQLTPLWRAARQ
ncbi:hypothetical protein HaLaN_31197, partial [Haematococcus lacustris]